MSRSGPVSPPSSAAQRAAFCGIAALQIGQSVARVSPASSGVTSNIVTLPSFDSATWSVPAVVISSMPVAVHDPGMLAAEPAQHLRHRLDPFRREHADQLALDAGRVGQRAEQIEDRARAELDPGRADMAHGAVMARRHQEADAGLPERALHQRHVAIDD